MTTHYATLGIAENASDEEIRQAHRRLSRASNQTEIKIINTAFNALKNPEKRRAYDEQLARTRRNTSSTNAFTTGSNSTSHFNQRSQSQPLQNNSKLKFPVLLWKSVFSLLLRSFLWSGKFLGKLLLKLVIFFIPLFKYPDGYSKWWGFIWHFMFACIVSIVSIITIEALYLRFILEFSSKPLNSYFALNCIFHPFCMIYFDSRRWVPFNLLNDGFSIKKVVTWIFWTGVMILCCVLSIPIAFLILFCKFIKWGYNPR